MNEHDDVMCQVRESFSGLRMDTPVERVFARSRVRRRRRLTGLTAAATATAGAAAAMTLVLSGPAPVQAGNSPSANPGTGAPSSGSLGSGNPSSANSGAVALAAFTVTSGPGDRTTLILRKGARLDPSALRQALEQHGIPAVVTVGTFCRSIPAPPAGLGQILQPLTVAGGQAMVINGQAMPPGTRLSIGYFPQQIRMTLIEDGARRSCDSTSRQPAMHNIPGNTPVHGGHAPATRPQSRSKGPA